MKVTFEKITNSQLIPLNIKHLYFDSFPEDERRDWSDICFRIDNSDPFFSFYVLQHNGENLGFITLWRLPIALYCEHFAIEATWRGQGLGGEVVKEAIAMAEALPGPSGLPFVLEVELPEKSEAAKRRIEFYKRNDLKPLEEFPYWQPPYRDDLREVPMMLMSSRELADPTTLVVMLHTLVYNQ